MSGNALDAAIAVASEAFAKLAEKEAAVAAATAKQRDIEGELESAKTERARAIELEDEDAAVRHVDGDEAMPFKPQRAKRIATLTAKIPALVAAIPLQKARVADCKNDLEKAKEPLAVAVVTAVVEIQEPAVEQLRTLVAEMESSLKDLIMADLIRAGTIGERFGIATGQKLPFAGATVARRLIAAIPERLRPPDFTVDRLDASARAAAALAIHRIKEKAR